MAKRIPVGKPDKAEIHDRRFFIDASRFGSTKYIKIKALKKQSTIHLKSSYEDARKN